MNECSGMQVHRFPGRCRRTKRHLPRQHRTLFVADASPLYSVHRFHRRSRRWFEDGGTRVGLRADGSQGGLFLVVITEIRSHAVPDGGGFSSLFTNQERDQRGKAMYGY